jgi:hypothetical protein
MRQFRALFARVLESPFVTLVAGFIKKQAFKEEIKGDVDDGNKKVWPLTGVD